MTHRPARDHAAAPLRERHPEPGSVPPAQALQWLAGGWSLFIAAPAIWVAQTLIVIVALAALGFVPLLGWAAAPLVLPMLVAGMLAGADALDRGEALRVGHLFEGMRRHAPNLLLLGVFHLLGALLAALIAAAVGGSAVLAGTVLGSLGGASLAAGGVMFGVFVFGLLWVLLMMALWFAPALVMLQDVAPFEAMRLSMRACLHSLLCFALLAVMLYVLVWAAMLPAGLGMLVLVPVLIGAQLRAWQDVFSPRPLLPPPTGGIDA